jgi:hypothetical protein
MSAPRPLLGDARTARMTTTAPTEDRIEVLEGRLLAYVLFKRYRNELRELSERERIVRAELERLRVLLTRADHPLGPIEETL